MEEVLDQFSSYDFRVDVRSGGEWNESHAEVSIFTPGLAKNPARDYLDVIGGKEDAKILVYCKSGYRAFAAAQNLLRYGFSDVHSLYPGGFPALRAAVEELSVRD